MVTFARFIAELEAIAGNAQSCEAQQAFGKHIIRVRVQYTEVHKFRASFVRTYWLNDKKMKLLDIMDIVQRSE